MSFENNLTLGIDKHHMRNTVDSILFTAVRFSSMIVDNLVPFFGVDMLNNSISSLINTDTNDLKFVTPFFSSFFKHFLIVGHWSLTWWAPSSPEINEPYFSWSVIQC